MVASLPQPQEQLQNRCVVMQRPPRSHKRFELCRRAFVERLVEVPLVAVKRKANDVDVDAKALERGGVKGLRTEGGR